MEKELKVTSSSERPRRVPIGQRSRISLRDRDPNYHYRLVNVNLDSDPDRVQNLMDIGYEVVPKKAVGKTGDTRVDNASAMGSASEVSVGQGTKAVWMRIDRKYFEEDQAAKQAEVDRTEQRAQKDGADYGKVTITSTRG
jgi:hypothetical protein